MQCDWILHAASRLGFFNMSIVVFLPAWFTISIEIILWNRYELWNIYFILNLSRFTSHPQRCHHHSDHNFFSNSILIKNQTPKNDFLACKWLGLNSRFLFSIGNLKRKFSIGLINGPIVQVKIKQIIIENSSKIEKFVILCRFLKR